MRKLLYVAMILLLTFNTTVFGWVDGTIPTGRIEASLSGGAYTIANGYFHDDNILKRAKYTITTSYGYAHSGESGLNQADADARATFWEDQYWYDVNRDGKSNKGDIPATAHNFLSRGIDDAVTTIRVYSVDDFPASGTVIIGDEEITYASKSDFGDILSGCTRGANGTANVVHSRNAYICTNVALSCPLTSNIDDAVTSIPGDYVGWPSSGFVIIDSEFIYYVDRTDLNLTNCVRDYDGAGTAAHTAPVTITISQGWRRRRYTMGSGQNVKGWDAAWPGVEVDINAGHNDDDGASSMVLDSGWFLRRIYVININGRTNMESGAVDQMVYWDTGAYVDGDGDAALGIEENEIVNFRVND